MYTDLEHRVRRNITTRKGICQLYTRAIGTNVCPAVGRLVDCASNREIILRYRNPVTTTPQSPPRAPLASLYPFHYFISCWIEARLSCIKRYCNDASSRRDIEILRDTDFHLCLFVDENCNGA